jgi:hypothetical protein
MMHGQQNLTTEAVTKDLNRWVSEEEDVYKKKQAKQWHQYRLW